MFFIFKGLNPRRMAELLATTFLLFVFPFSVSGNDELKETPRQDMLKRLEDLEEQLLEIQLKESNKVPVTSFDSLKLDFGGFITQTFTSNFNGDSPDRSSFDQTNLESLIGADITENHRFFTAMGFHRQADLVNEATAISVDLRRFAGSANRVPLIIAWGQRTFSNLLDFTYGRFVPPWGIINREHFPPTLMNLNQPQFLRATQPGNLFGGNTFTPNFFQGVQAHGSKFINNHQLEQLAYTGHFNGGGSSDFISVGKLQWSLPTNQATLGGSYQNGVRTSTTNNHYDLFGVDLKVDYKGFLLKSEYIYSGPLRHPFKFTKDEIQSLLQSIYYSRSIILWRKPRPLFPDIFVEKLALPISRALEKANSRQVVSFKVHHDLLKLDGEAFIYKEGLNWRILSISNLSESFRQTGIWKDNWKLIAKKGQRYSRYKDVLGLETENFQWITISGKNIKLFLSRDPKKKLARPTINQTFEENIFL